MCGRYTRKYKWKEIRLFLDLKFPKEGEGKAEPELEPSYNVAPSQQAPIIRHERRELVMARWGLVPSWAKDESIGNKMINARAEGIDEKPAFRSAFKSRRCLVPVSGFYEWRAVEGSKTKQPWYFTRADGEIMLLAGLWEQKGELETYTIITTEANAFISQVHHRMPVVLEKEEVEAWLHGGNPNPGALLDPAPDGILVGRPVSTRVNSPKTDDADLICPLPEQESPSSLFSDGPNPL